MTDQEIYETIMSDNLLQKYVDENNYVRLYRLLKERDSAIKFGELTAFLKAADIDILVSGVVPTEAFKDDKSFTEFDFSKIKTIEPSAFEGSGIRKVVLNKGQEVGIAAFKDSAVEELYLGAGVKVGNAAFARCKNLKELYVRGDVQLGKLAFASCRNLEEVAFDDGRNNWPEDLFANVKHIDYVTLPFPHDMNIFDRDIEIDVLYLNCSRDDYRYTLEEINREFPRIKDLQFLK